MDQEDQRIARRGMLDVVMPLDDLANSLRELPSLREDYPAVTVGETKRFLFLLVEGAAALNRVSEHLAVLVRVGQRIDDDTEIVQQASQVRFVLVGVGDLLGKFAADQG